MWIGELNASSQHVKHTLGTAANVEPPNKHYHGMCFLGCLIAKKLQATKQQHSNSCRLTTRRPQQQHKIGASSLTPQQQNMDNKTAGYTARLDCLVCTKPSHSCCHNEPATQLLGHNIGCRSTLLHYHHDTQQHKANTTWHTTTRNSA